jgi:vancomycin resistance protein YoaR
MINHKLLTFIGVIILEGLALLHPSQAQAAAAPDITIENDTSKFMLDGTLAQSWNKYVVLPGGSVTERPAQTLDELKQLYLTGTKPTPTTQQSIYHYNPELVYEWAAALAPNLAATPQEPVLEVANNKAASFQPPVPGQVLDPRQTALNILAALESKKTTAELSVLVTPTQTQLASTNNLGIKELVGRGESNFKGSPKNRIHNIKVGIEKLKGTLIAPGEEFSFNKNICPVDKSGGYLPELVILASGVTPEYGGGLCQVSSTTFRAVMDSGLPVTQRRNHSFAVQYYAPQGSDATTYCGGLDLKFKNDTPGSILIWPYIKEGTTILTFDFYGTKDGRQVTLDVPIQYDRQASGAMKAYWNRTVTLASGEERKDTFKSTYLSPALFHKPPPEPTTLAPVIAPTDGTIPLPDTTPSPTPPPSATPTMPLTQ